MFEDSTFESTGRIRTRSRGWMIAAFAFNGSILLAFILIPLIYPEALPRIGQFILMEAPPPPAEQPKPQGRPEHAVVVKPEFNGGPIVAPSVIPKTIVAPAEPEALAHIDLAELGPESGGPAGPDNPFRDHTALPVV